jgi:RNA polymerase sigma factor (sigma-70 family)
LHRDRKPLDEAIAIVSTQDGAPSPSELEQLATELPARRPHPVRVSPDDVASQLAVSSDAESRVMAADRQQTANKVMRVLAKSLAALPPDDQALLRMRYAQDMTVAEIARMLQVEQKPLYRRIEAIKKDLRKQLINGGIKPEDVADIVGRNDTRLDFVLLLMGKPATRSSSNNGSGTGD